MAMRLIFLGTGTSTGVPEVGCGCICCRSRDPRDKRLRTSALVLTSGGKRILIDCGPDFRQQANHIGLDGIDAILLTHEHYDHVYGLDDLRTIAWRREIPIYGQAKVLEAVKKRMHYVFSPNPYPGTPKLVLRDLALDERITIGDVEVSPILVMHGSLPIYGYRFHEVGTDEQEDLCYITDMKSIDPIEWSKVEGSRLLVVNALRHIKEHPSHQSLLDVERLVASLRRKPELTLITHLSHHAPRHRELCELMSHYASPMLPAYDYAVVDMASELLEPCDYEPCVSYLAFDEEIAPVVSTAETEVFGGFELSVDDNSLALSIEQDARLYPTSVDLGAVIGEAVLSLSAFMRVSREEMSRCFALRKVDSREGFFRYELSLSVNGEGDSLRCLSGSVAPLDMTVVKHMVTGYLYAALKGILKQDYKGSL